MLGLKLDAFRATPLVREPFPYLIVPRFIRREALAGIHADYPRIDQPGSFPVGGLQYGPAFRRLLAALEGPEMRTAFAEKFQMDLTGRPTMVTVRGRCGPKDGNIHTDAATKLLTVLIYMNPAWEGSGGCLRLLRSPDDLNDVLVEIPPVEGTLVAFRRTENSYHGHRPFLGPRRVIQLNWVTSAAVRHRELARHQLSSWMKKAVALFLRPWQHARAIS
jgi:hypothetical protein